MKQNLSMIGLFVAVFLLSGAYFSTTQEKLQTTEPAQNVDIYQFPVDFPNWKGEKAGDLGQMEINILKLDSWIKRAYVNPSGSFIHFYMGYWKKQTGDYQAAKHSPLLCLPSNGWVIHDIERIELPITGLAAPAPVVRLIGDYKNQTNVVYFWFFAGEKVFTSDFSAIFHSSLGTLISGRSDGGIIEITVPVQPVKGSLKEGIPFAQQTAENFISEMYSSFVKITKGVKSQ